MLDQSRSHISDHH